MKEEKKALKILFVSQSILPYTGASAFVTESLISNFDKEEVVVVGERVLLLGKTKRPADSPKYYYCLSNLTFKGKGKRFLNIFRWIFLFPALLIRMQYILKKHKCNYVLGVFPDNYYLAAAFLISKLNRLPLSTYFHNTYLENRPTGPNHWLASKLQPAVFKRSRHIFVMSEAMQWYYEKTYPEYKKFIPLLHTFNELPPKNERDLFTKKDKYELILMGTFNASNIDATSRLINALKKDGRYHIKMFSHVPKFLLKQRGIDVDSIDYRGFVSNEDFMKELQANDICLLTHGFSGGYSRAEYETIFPTRAIQFLISGVPIFAHTPDFSFLAQLLKKYDAAEVAEIADEQDLRDRMEKFINDPERRRTVVENAGEMARRYYGPNVVKFLKDTLLN